MGHFEVDDPDQCRLPNPRNDVAQSREFRLILTQIMPFYQKSFEQTAEFTANTYNI